MARKKKRVNTIEQYLQVKKEKEVGEKAGMVEVRVLSENKGERFSQITVRVQSTVLLESLCQVLSQMSTKMNDHLMLPVCSPRLYCDPEAVLEVPPSDQLYPLSFYLSALCLDTFHLHLLPFHYALFLSVSSAPSQTAQCLEVLFRDSESFRYQDKRIIDSLLSSL